ncbi:MAG TPA: DUF5615 family PIN-like protein [Terriglobia bacterium]|jgi:predicted nuclease of predicted toxin-antitoxin system|nr:DUF5615 family PIN-like protein [Terriglobia bacterium]
MKVKLDENLGASLARLFREGGHDTATVPEEGLASAPDGRLIEVCRDEQRVLVTLDLEFGNPLLFKPADYEGIAVLRPGGKASLERLKALARTLIQGLRTRDIRRKLWIVEMERIREHEED